MFEKETTHFMYSYVHLDEDHKELLVLVVINLSHDNFCLVVGVCSATSAYAEVHVNKLLICREARWTFPKCQAFLLCVIMLLVALFLDFPSTIS